MRLFPNGTKESFDEDKNFKAYSLFSLSLLILLDILSFSSSKFDIFISLLISTLIFVFDVLLDIFLLFLLIILF